MPAPFADFPIRPDILEALEAAGFTNAFPIQELTLPVALTRQDIIGQAKTGTGKTLGFGIPLLHHVIAPHEDGWEQLPGAGKPQALVIVPTRELAIQVANDLEVASRCRTLRILQVYGGKAYEPQVAALVAGIEVVVGTPGRIRDLLRQGHLELTHTRTVVLDEADRMLDLGFLPDVEAIITCTSPTRQTMLFSATMPAAVVAMARRYMNHPAHIRADDPEDSRPTLDSITQIIYRAHMLDKPELVARALQSEGRGLTIIFTHTKRTAARVADDLSERGFAVAQLHGDMGQGAREQAMRAFRNGKVDVLVATDVAARGLDIDDVTHVINYECPDDEHDYLHRTGRTGRAGRKGVALTLVDWPDIHRWGVIDRQLELGVPVPPEMYSSSPQLYADLHIPADTKGRLPRAQQHRAGLAAERQEDIGETGKRAGKGRQPGRGGSASRTGASSRGSDKVAGGRRRLSEANSDQATGTTRTAGSSNHAGAASQETTTEKRIARAKRVRRRTRGGKPLSPDTTA